MVLTYIGLGVVSCVAIAATWRIMNKKYRPTAGCNRIFFDCINDPEGCGGDENIGWWGPPGLGKTHAAGSPECDVCGQWMVGLTCFECVAWADDIALLGQRRDSIAAFIGSITCCHGQYDGRVWPNEIEHRRLVKKVGW